MLLNNTYISYVYNILCWLFWNVSSLHVNEYPHNGSFLKKTQESLLFSLQRQGRERRGEWLLTGTLKPKQQSTPTINTRGTFKKNWIQCAREPHFDKFQRDFCTECNEALWLDNFYITWQEHHILIGGITTFCRIHEDWARGWSAPAGRMYESLLLAAACCRSIRSSFSLCCTIFFMNLYLCLSSVIYSVSSRSKTLKKLPNSGKLKASHCNKYNKKKLKNEIITRTISNLTYIDHSGG